MYTSWSCNLPGGGTADELALSYDKARDTRLLIAPPFFAEANKFRRQLAEIAYRLDRAGIDVFLPDLPGQNESVVSLRKQDLGSWKDAMRQAAAEFAPSHILTIRSGALLTLPALPGWQFEPKNGRSVLRSLLRARVLSSKETGRSENTTGLLAEGRRNGLTLAGWQLGSKMIAELEDATLELPATQAVISQTDIGGSGLWLRAEPDEDAEQADALAAMIAVGMLAE